MCIKQAFFTNSQINKSKNCIECWPVVKLVLNIYLQSNLLNTSAQYSNSEIFKNLMKKINI